MSIITPTTTPIERPNHGCPQRGTTTAENPSATPTISPAPRTTGRCRRASANPGRICGRPGCVMANANTALRKKLAAVTSAIDDDERERGRPAPGVEVLPLERVRLEVEHRDPDPHRRQDLDEREPPVDENEPQTLEEHHERADREHERGKDPPRPAQREHGRLDRRLVPGLYRIDERAALRPQNLATRTARVFLPVRGGRHQPASSVGASLSARQPAQTGENTAQTSESVIMMKT